MYILIYILKFIYIYINSRDPIGEKKEAEENNIKAELGGLKI